MPPVAPSLTIDEDETDPSPVANPIRRLRLDQNSYLKQFARRIGVNHQLLYLVERGCYARIPAKILAFCTNYLDQNQTLLVAQYEAYQFACRLAFGTEFHLDTFTTATLGEYPAPCSPLETFRNQLNLSRVALAKQLCVQPAILYKLDQALIKNLPTHFTWAFSEAHLPDELITELDERTMDYYYSNYSRRVSFKNGR